MTRHPVDHAADHLERGARAVAAGFIDYAASSPNDERAGIVAATAAQIVSNAAMRAGLVSSELAASMVAEMNDAGEEITKRVEDGLQSPAAGEVDSARLRARFGLQLSQIRMTAWESAGKQLRELFPGECSGGA